MFCASIVSFTTDMGTEGGFATMPKVKLKELCPFFRESYVDATGTAEETIGQEDADMLADENVSGVLGASDHQASCVPGAACPPEPSQPPCGNGGAPGAACPPEPGYSDMSLHDLFPNATAVFGTLHIGHGATEKLTNSLEHFQDWFTLFQVVINFFRDQSSRQNFMQQCLTGPRFHFRALFRTFRADVAEWRWGTLMAAIEEEQKIKEVVTTFWDDERMDAALKQRRRQPEEGAACPSGQAGVQNKQGGRPKVAEVTVAIRNNFQ
jgi:hypothetical protein